MTNHLIEAANQHSIERPAFLDKISPRHGGEKKIKILKIAETLNKMKKTQCLKFSSSEFEKDFGVFKVAKPYFLTTLKTYGIKKPRIVVDQGTCYIWCNDIE